MNATHVYHKIMMNGRKSKYSAWFCGDPKSGANRTLSILVDCERIDSLGRSFPCTDSEQDTLRNGSWFSSQWHKFKQPAR